MHYFLVGAKKLNNLFLGGKTKIKIRKPKENKKIFFFSYKKKHLKTKKKNCCFMTRIVGKLRSKCRFDRIQSVLKIEGNIY